jgi:hypothetical protein
MIRAPAHFSSNIFVATFLLAEFTKPAYFYSVCNPPVLAPYVRLRPLLKLVVSENLL